MTICGWTAHAFVMGAKGCSFEEKVELGLNGELKLTREGEILYFETFLFVQNAVEEALY